MKLRLTVDGKVYEVEVEVANSQWSSPPEVRGSLPAAAAAAPVAAAPSAPSAPVQPGADVDEDKVCRSPISGVVVRVPAQVGQDVQANDPMMVLEAMKMETVIASKVSGKVARINAQVGDSVQVGQVLLEFA